MALSSVAEAVLEGENIVSVGVRILIDAFTSASNPIPREPRNEVVLEDGHDQCSGPSCALDDAWL